MEVQEQGDRDHRRRRHDEREPAHGDEVAVGEVDQPENPEEQPDAERAEGVETAQAQAGDDRLDDDFHQNAASPMCSTPSVKPK